MTASKDLPHISLDDYFITASAVSSKKKDRLKRRSKKKKHQPKCITKAKGVDHEYQDESKVAAHENKGNGMESSAVSQHTTLKHDGRFESKYGNLYLQFQNSDPNLCFSRLGGATMRGSTRIMCKTRRVAFLLLWSVFRNDNFGGKRISIDIQIVPIVNCSSSLENDSLYTISRQTSDELVTQFYQDS